MNRYALPAVLLTIAIVATASPCRAACAPADLDNDGVVGPADLASLLGDWGSTSSPADLDGSGAVDAGDLAILLGAWGPASTDGGAFPKMWINGGNCGAEPDIQIHQYNENMYILRQSLCTDFEGPFMYLLFGEDKVLMQDTGAGGIAIANTVYGIIDDWLAAHDQASIDLIVTHSHGHGDHTAGDSQFNGQADTTVVGTGQSSVANFFGITSWPTQIVEYDLGGGRIIDVIPIPGHQSAHIALYDRNTGILFTGDTLYPGRLYFSSGLVNTYRASIQRMVDFTADKPTCQVLGTHIEMTNTPGDDYSFGATFHPNEHPLQLDRDHLLELLDGVNGMLGSPHIEIHDDFIIYPL